MSFFLFFVLRLIMSPAHSFSVADLEYRLGGEEPTPSTPLFALQPCLHPLTMESGFPNTHALSTILDTFVGTVVPLSLSLSLSLSLFLLKGLFMTSYIFIFLAITC